MTFRWLRRLFGCAHDFTYRERRKNKLHLVCDDCGHATPVGMSDPVKARALRRQIAKPKAAKKSAPIYVLPKLRAK